MKSITMAFVFLLAITGPAVAQRTSVSRQFPVYDNGGKPDLTVDPQRFVSQMEIVDRLFDVIEARIHVPDPRNTVTVVP